MKVCGSPSPTWRVIELTCTELCSSTRNLEGSGSKGEERSSRSTIPPNDPEYEDVEGKTLKAMSLLKGGSPSSSAISTNVAKKSSATHSVKTINTS
ncbi:hypothetical protein H5410_046152 [Solanum commersonii]|uniref:Uncharacterized protein n=1 Tax=Solanum commersonii TaxID=4109 RepID=A0A9J5XEU5_SOLCO|nr:hypothetical protein H5410_046152 [Solanum commersonii]